MNPDYSLCLLKLKLNGTITRNKNVQVGFKDILFFLWNKYMFKAKYTFKYRTCVFETLFSVKIQNEYGWFFKMESVSGRGIGSCDEVGVSN